MEKYDELFFRRMNLYLWNQPPNKLKTWNKSRQSW